MKRNSEGGIIKDTVTNKQPAKLVNQCLRVIGQSEFEPRERYQFYEGRWNYKGDSDEFWINFITQLTYNEIVDLQLDSKKEEELFRIYKDHKSIDFKKIEIKFKESVHGPFGTWTNRDRMLMENLDLQNNKWIEQFLKIENGMIECTIPRSGKYQIIQQSRSMNQWKSGKPSLGVNIELRMGLTKVKNVSKERLLRKNVYLGRKTIYIHR